MQMQGNMQQKSKKPRVSPDGREPMPGLIDLTKKVSHRGRPRPLLAQMAARKGPAVVVETMDEETRRCLIAEREKREQEEFYSRLKDPKTTRLDRLDKFHWKWHEFVYLEQGERAREVSLGNNYLANYFVSRQESR